MRTLLALTLVVVVLGGTAGAGAQSAAESAEGKKHFEAGLRLYRENALQEALAEFRLSYQLGRRSSALKNAAQCERDLKHFAEAYETYEELLATHGAKLPDAERKALQRALDELGVLTGTIAFKATEAGIAVELDGKPLGTTPIERPKRVSLGSHQIHATRAGFEPLDRQVDVGSGAAIEVALALAPEVTTGHVTVREQRDRPVHLFIDGADVGPLPYSGELAPGEHGIEARGPDHAADRRVIQVEKKGKLDVVIDAAPLRGQVRVIVTPTSARIRIDGVDRGTGSWDGSLDPGPHRVEVSSEGYRGAVRQIEVVRGGSAVVEVPLSAVASAAPVDAPPYRGMYGRFNVLFAVAPSPKGYELPSTAPAGAEVDDTFALGGGAALRLGYSFDWWSLEVLGMFAFAHEETAGRWGPEMAYDPDQNDTLFGMDAFTTIVGFGPRVTSEHDVIRFTLGVAPGLLIRNVLAFNRNEQKPNCSGGVCNGSYKEFSASDSYFAPAVAADGGILLGSTPGTKFFLGVHAWVDFAPTLVEGPDNPSAAAGGSNLPFPDGYFDATGRRWKATHGTEYYVGPALGVQFGH
jgi:hypothetical protein